MNEDEKDLEHLAMKYGGEVVEPELFGKTVAFCSRDERGFWSASVYYEGTRRRLSRCDLAGEVWSTVEHYPDDEDVMQDHIDSACFGLILTPTDLIAVDSATDG